jgi:hypothetical protein
MCSLLSPADQLIWLKKLKALFHFQEHDFKNDFFTKEVTFPENPT